jgi:Lrp/AsnC family transcriptional regulator for asnA, asnC and gidA
MSMAAGIDRVDLTILSMLQEDARKPFTQIAEKLAVSDATIHFRVRKMEQMGVIEKYTIILNEEKMGVPITTYVLIRVDPGAVEAVCRRLLDLEEVYEVTEIHEWYDILVKVKGRSLDEVRDILIQKIRSIPHVLGSEAYPVYKTWKHDIRVAVPQVLPGESST